MPTQTKPGYFKRNALEGAGEFYREYGYLVVEDGMPEEDLVAIERDMLGLLRGEYGPIRNYEAPSEPLGDDELLARVLCIHQAHHVAPAIRRSLDHPTMVDVLTRAIGPNVKCMQSMLFVKSAGKPGQAWHQDEDYIPTRDRSLAGGWIAIDEATVDNGCLWVIPGSHKPGVLWPQYPHRDKRFDCAQASYDFPYDEDRDAVAVEVPRGAIVYFNGYLLHRSLPNTRSQGYRRALVNHYMSAESLLPWVPDPKLPMAQVDHRDIVMIAGEDPYAWKGLKHEVRPHIRPAGEGGCGDGRVTLEEHKQGLAAAREA